MKDDLSPRGGSRGRMRSALVVAQVAVSLLLLVGAGLVVRSLEAARTANVGFDERHVTAVTVDLRSSGYDERARTGVLRATARCTPGPARQ